jgi:ATPase subunit of ABC transporter with duplicated ATPase domains
MSHKPLTLNNLSLELPHKTCFTDFNVTINYGDHIAIIGRNGSGKSSLLNMLRVKSPNITIGYVPQIIENFIDLSGGERFNAVFTQALIHNPDILLLDEPTNHLDLKNRKSLIRSLKSFPGTLIIVSHDVELLRNSIDRFWHIDNGKITIFSGNYDDYMRDIQSKRNSIEAELARLERHKKDMHQNLMQEQARAAKSKQKGRKSIEQRKWPTIVSDAKTLQAQETSGRKKSAIDYKKQDLLDKLTDLRLPEVIIPKFSLSAADIGDRSVVSIQDASIGYTDPILQNINLELSSKNRIAIKGNNGRGKTTLIKAILNDPIINKTGNWYVTKILVILISIIQLLSPILQF